MPKQDIKPIPPAENKSKAPTGDDITTPVERKETTIPTNEPPPDTFVETQPSKESIGKPNVHLPAPAPSNIPVIEAGDSPDIEAGIDGCVVPSDDKFTDGIYVKDDDKLKYALCIHDPDTYGNTHTCKNTKYLWQGTKEQFKQKFTKE